MKIRLTCPKCEVVKTLVIRTLDLGLKIRTRCICGQAITARPTGRAAKSGELMDTLRGIYAAADRLAATKNVDAPDPAL